MGMGMGIGMDVGMGMGMGVGVGICKGTSTVSVPARFQPDLPWRFI
jgi:hypothetical protein